jgi:hypothetical protein
MAEIDIEADDDLVEGVKRLAVRHYGDDSEASQQRVVESALDMRILWAHLGEGGKDEIEEPIANWEFGNGQPAKQFPDEVGGWLFKRR